MCGIFGLGFMRGNSIKDAESVRNIIRSLFTENMARGRTASGLAYVSYEGIKVIKKNVPADVLINLPEYRETENELIKPGAANINGISLPISVIGHCRLKTKGTELKNVNNHPIVRSDVVGVHNGCIANDDNLFSTYSNLFDRNGEVDSEIIFALIEHFSKNNKMPIHASIQSMSHIVMGSFACAMVHYMHPHVVWLFRRSNPCELILFEDIGMVMWSSDINHIRNSIKDFDHNTNDVKEIKISMNSGVGIDLHRNRIHHFELETQNSLYDYVYD
jgi:glucosamine 6-phosphate synthetase-like amidotransferase/phosphosugar isomerase protein